MILPGFEEECAAEIAVTSSLPIRVDANIHAPCLSAGSSALNSAKQTDTELEIGDRVKAQNNLLAMPGRKPNRHEWGSNLSSAKGDYAVNQNSVRPSGMGI